MEDHYSTFIQEEDIAQIAGAGLNWIRLPIPFWAIETWQDVGVDSDSSAPVGEPFLAKVCWQCVSISPGVPCVVLTPSGE